MLKSKADLIPAFNSWKSKWSRAAHYLFAGNKSRISLIWFRCANLARVSLCCCSHCLKPSSQSKELNSQRLYLSIVISLWFTFFCSVVFTFFFSLPFLSTFPSYFIQDYTLLFLCALCVSVFNSAYCIIYARDAFSSSSSSSVFVWVSDVASFISVHLAIESYISCNGSGKIQWINNKKNIREMCMRREQQTPYRMQKPRCEKEIIEWG